jgi:hypothetical protein
MVGPHLGTTSRDFKRQLQYGRQFEDRFAKQLILEGWFVTPKYLFAEEGAPLLIGKKFYYAIPDIDAAKNGRRIWVECKRKNKMKYHPATGYPLRNHKAYKQVQEITGDKVFIIFEDVSLGLAYGDWLDHLEKHIYRNNFKIEGRPHILFKYPDAFRKVIKIMGDRQT